MSIRLKEGIMLVRMQLKMLIQRSTLESALTMSSTLMNSESFVSVKQTEWLEQ